jgi:hypothetical protein
VRKTLADDAPLEERKLGRQAARPDAEILGDSRAEIDAESGRVAVSVPTGAASPFGKGLESWISGVLDPSLLGSGSVVAVAPSGVYGEFRLIEGAERG